MPGGKAQRHKTAFNAPIAEKSINRAQHFSRTMLLWSQAAQSADSHCAIKRRRAALPADVAHRHAQFLRAVTQKIVKVAAELARGDDASRDVEAELRPRQTRQQRTLNASRRAQIAFQARCIVCSLFVQSR